MTFLFVCINLSVTLIQNYVDLPIKGEDDVIFLKPMLFCIAEIVGLFLSMLI